MSSNAPTLDVAAEDPVGCLVHKLRVRDEVTDAEADILRNAAARVEDVPLGRTLVAAGQKLDQSMLIVSGFVARYKDLSNGQRQITDIHVAGDFTDLHGFLLKRLEHNVGTLAPTRIAFVPHERLTRISEEQPHLLRMLWLSTLIDSAIQRERMLSVGRRSAVARIAHLMCELYTRLSLVNEVDGLSFALPITQIDIADVAGLTSVHVNRMLRELRDRGLVTFRNALVEIHDLAGLEKLADFDRSYLFLESEPR
ncbi:Crp/Fnr family transcriptional regulator [Sphingosinicella sp. YJ22]|uniref:Crp/Fnr family transcriptional regulator n=1 Tax=Sphingosinicella sp. YJ22 TaxID=1104780 RepID=UPI00140747AE|nr:Crp/Fnr family transcriptional regulator [Sphingosinicella sp. YJ22]